MNIERVEVPGFAELVSMPVERAPSNRGHRREHDERAREKARERDRALTLDGVKPAGRALPSPVSHLPKLDFDPNKPYVSKPRSSGETPVPGVQKPAVARPQRTVAALLGGFGKKS
jgi:ATP-dependent RNA helicase RhlE